jgi:hypothetical protein
VFIDDSQFAALWMKLDRCYLVIAEPRATRLASLVGAANLHIVMQSGGKLLLTNQPLPGGTPSHGTGNVQP